MQVVALALFVVAPLHGQLGTAPPLVLSVVPIFATMFRGPLTTILLRLGAVGLVYSLLRVLFWLYNRELFPAPPLEVFLGGMRFDASAIAWLNLPWVLLVLISPAPRLRMKRIQLGVFLAVNAIGLFFNCVDLGYYAFSLKRSTADFLQILTTGNDALNLLPTFVRDFWHIALIYVGSLAFLALAYVRIGKREQVSPALPWQIGWRIVALGLFVLASRGGIQLIPLQPLDGARYGGASYLPVVLNTPFTMLTTLGKPTIEERDYMPQEEADERWPVVQHFEALPPPSPLPANPAFSERVDKPNVVVIILESFSALYSHELSGGPGYMPFLDSLMQQGLNFTNAYSNGRRSIDGIPSILASMPQWMDEAFITSTYASQPFTSMAELLGGEGYSTSFFHGGRNGTMGFDGFAKSAGFDRYVGMNEYTNNGADFDGHWGVRDRPFMQFHARELAKEKQPFLSTMFTLSSHHPYELPAEELERFGSGTQPIHATLRYTDDALRGFFATASTMPWYDNTLFVITADHTADLERTGSQGQRPIDYWIPLVYYSPKPVNSWEERMKEGGFQGVSPMPNDGVTQHIDILPSVMELIGYDKPFFSFGHSSIGTTKGRAVWANNGIYTITRARQQLLFDGEQVLDVISLEDGTEPNAIITAEMERDLQAALQQYSRHILRNELVLKPAKP